MSFTLIGQTVPTQLEKSQSGDGHNVGEVTLPATVGDTSKIVKWLLGKTPGQVDSEAVLRANSHGVGLAVRIEGRYPRGENGEYVPSYDAAVSCDIDGTEDDRKSAIADLVNFCIPAKARMIEEWVTELSSITAGRTRNGADAALTLNAYSARLGKYPADVVRHALTVKRWKWFPTWDELAHECDILSAPRRLMIDALIKGPPPPKRGYVQTTPEQRAEMQKYVEERFPGIALSKIAGALNEADGKVSHE